MIDFKFGMQSSYSKLFKTKIMDLQIGQNLYILVSISYIMVALYTSIKKICNFTINRDHSNKK